MPSLAHSRIFEVVYILIDCDLLLSIEIAYVIALVLNIIICLIQKLSALNHCVRLSIGTPRLFLL